MLHRYREDVLSILYRYDIDTVTIRYRFPQRRRPTRHETLREGFSGCVVFHNCPKIVPKSASLREFRCVSAEPIEFETPQSPFSMFLGFSRQAQPKGAGVAQVTAEGQGNKPKKEKYTRGTEKLRNEQ